MRRSTISLVRAAVVLSATAAVLMSSGPTAPVEAQQKPADSKAGEGKAPALVYKPPLRGAPGGRVGGGTRGTGREAFVLSVLAPNHTGLTTSEQPTLFWFISHPSSYPIELTLVDPDKTDPLIELRLQPPVAEGVHRLRLRDHNVRLAPGTAYQWFVAVVPDGGRRSKDILAGGMIERVTSPAELTEKIARASKAEIPGLYAEAGLWYDAIGTLGELLDQAPDDTALQAQRSALLRQIGLPDVGIR
jgi:hypothetical protein